MYTDLLTRITNAQRAKKKIAKALFSRMDEAIAELLAKHGYIEGCTRKGRLPRRVLEIKLKYGANGEGAIRGVRFVSTPARRIYAGYRRLHPVRQGYGIAVLTTPAGILTEREAKRGKVGGQALFEIW